MRYVAIRSEGGLLPYDLLDKIAADQVPGQKPADFGLPKGERVIDEISRVWADAQNLWSNFKRRRQALTDRDPYGTSITRTWIVSLLSDPEMLGFDLKLQASAVVVNNLTFAISHRDADGEAAIPVHIEGCKIDLDRRLHTKLRTSPQAMLQDFLNNSEQCPWGILTNGVTLRLLRNSSRTSRPTYLEFDLESILEGNRFNEFALLYRLCHSSRFPKPGQEPSDCLLEDYYQESLDEGSRVRERLRDGVEDALKVLGTALIRHPANTALRDKVANKDFWPQYHRELLLLVYRLLFLMVAEERGLLVSQGAKAEHNQKIYEEWYSVTRLRERASQIIEESPFGDLWQGLHHTFALFEYGLDTNPLGIPPLNGDLFDQKRAIPDLAGTELYNHDLLLAVRRLSIFKDEKRGPWMRINYSHLDVEELGSVYESLLDYQPIVQPAIGGLQFELSPGMERKSTGSYYTRPELVHELIESALVPVMEDRLAKAEKETAGKDLLTEQKAKQKALLDMSVCDPACGSGHFLLAAARRLGKELARIRTGEDEPKSDEFHLAVRDVISHCIYGVDLNPLAVDLCKVALWLEGHWAGKPLSFLDHRIRCGNSLIGVLNPEVLEQGIPDDAFTAVTGDDKKVAAFFKKRNKQDQKSRGFVFEPEEHATEYATSNRELKELVENTAADVRKKAQIYGSWRAGMQHSHDEAVADLWTAQFFLPLTSTIDPAICTTKDFLDFAIDKRKKPQQVAAAQAMAQQARFFHWHLEFPEVFDQGGFDVVLGNPPWDKLKLMQVEFFAVRAPEIAKATTQAQRHKLIRTLNSTRPELFNEWQLAVASIERENLFIRSSSRFAHTAVGELNTYALFTELAMNCCRPLGKTGLIVKSSLITADTYGEFFSHLADQDLISAYDFKNWALYFPDIGFHERYTLLTLQRDRQGSSGIRIGVELVRVEEIADPEKTYTLTTDELKLFSPLSGTCPLFRNRIEKEIARYVYGRFPVLVRSQRTENPWGLTYATLFHMSSDSNLFHRKQELLSTGARLLGGRFQDQYETYLPLYEGKYIQIFNHRFASYEGTPEELRFTRKAPTVSPSSDQLEDASYEIEPRYWVRRSVTVEALQRQIEVRDYYVLARLVTNVISNNRTTIACIAPAVACNNLALILYLDGADRQTYAKKSLLFVTLLDSFVFDFMARLKVSENLLKSTLFEIPAPIPAAFQPHAPHLRSTLEQFVMLRAAELSCTTWSLASVLSDLHVGDRPYKWNDERRFVLRCELDAAFFHMYFPSDINGGWLQAGIEAAGVSHVFGTPRQAVGYVMDTFPIVQRRDEERFGEFRTKRVILDIYDRMQEAISNGTSYQSVLDPPAGDTSLLHPAKAEFQTVHSPDKK
jgi:hypothetical protein